MLFRKSKRARENSAEYILDQNSPFGIKEAYKSLRTNLIFSLPGDHCKTIVITSSMEEEAKSTTCCNLAITLAQNKSRVLLIDCDLRRPTIQGKLNLADETGLTNVLVGKANLKEVIHKLDNGVYVITAGKIPPNPSELLGSEYMKRVINELEKHFDYILIDTPPLTAVTDAVVLTKLSSGVLLVVREDFATTDSVAAALQKLKIGNAKVLGFVYTDMRNDKMMPYSKKSGYSYSKYYGTKPQS